MRYPESRSRYGHGEMTIGGLLGIDDFEHTCSTIKARSHMHSRAFSEGLIIPRLKELDQAIVSYFNSLSTSTVDVCQSLIFNLIEYQYDPITPTEFNASPLAALWMS
jgi:hypothetical protein